MDETPKYLEVAAQMLDVDIKELKKEYPGLVDRLGRINKMILKVKPYGLYQSTQAIGAVIDQYFMEQKLASRIASLEDRIDGLNDYLSPRDSSNE